MSFYADNAKTRAADAASDVAPRKHTPAPTQPELSDGVAELSAISTTDADGTLCYGWSSFLFFHVFIIQLHLRDQLKPITFLEKR